MFFFLKCNFKFPSVLYFPSLLKETAHHFPQENPLARDIELLLREKARVFRHQIQEHTVSRSLQFLGLILRAEYTKREGWT